MHSDCRVWHVPPHEFNVLLASTAVPALHNAQPSILITASYAAFLLHQLAVFLRQLNLQFA